MNPDDVQRIPGDCYLFYFGTRECDLPRLPLGTTFEVVYSPSHMGTIAQGWHIIHFEVVYRMNRVFKEYQRAYAEIERRALEEGEIAWLEALIV